MDAIRTTVRLRLSVCLSKLPCAVPQQQQRHVRAELLCLCGVPCRDGLALPCALAGGQQRWLATVMVAAAAFETRTYSLTCPTAYAYIPCGRARTFAQPAIQV